MDQYHDTDPGVFCYRCGHPIYDEYSKKEMVCITCSERQKETLTKLEYDYYGRERSMEVE
jgi:hypothetical protein